MQVAVPVAHLLFQVRHVLRDGVDPGCSAIEARCWSNGQRRYDLSYRRREALTSAVQQVQRDLRG
jgi:hypothetical protein